MLLEIDSCLLKTIHKAVAYVYSMISMLYKFLKYKKKSIIIGFRDFICQKKGKK